jgi:hypothetical protein
VEPALGSLGEKNLRRAQNGKDAPGVGIGSQNASLASSVASTSVPHIVTKSTRQDVLHRRLITQRLIGGGLPTAADVGRLLGCVQSHE